MNIFPIKYVRIIRLYVFLYFCVGIRHPSIKTDLYTLNGKLPHIGYKKNQKVDGSPLVLDILVLTSLILLM